MLKAVVLKSSVKENFRSNSIKINSLPLVFCFKNVFYKLEFQIKYKNNSKLIVTLKTKNITLF